MFKWLSHFFGKKTVISSSKTLHLITCQIHGSHYYQCLELVQSNALHPNEQLMLSREPNNDYDEYAIEVFNADRVKLGYIPKNHNRVIAELMDQQCHIYAIVERVEPDNWEPVIIQVKWAQ